MRLVCALYFGAKIGSISAMGRRKTFLGYPLDGNAREIPSGSGSCGAAQSQRHARQARHPPKCICGQGGALFMMHADYAGGIVSAQRIPPPGDHAAGQSKDAGAAFVLQEGHNGFGKFHSLSTLVAARSRSARDLALHRDTRNLLVDDKRMWPKQEVKLGGRFQAKVRSAERTGSPDPPWSRLGKGAWGDLDP